MKGLSPENLKGLSPENPKGLSPENPAVTVEDVKLVENNNIQNPCQ